MQGSQCSQLGILDTTQTTEFCTLFSTFDFVMQNDGNCNNLGDYDFQIVVSYQRLRSTMLASLEGQERLEASFSDGFVEIKLNVKNVWPRLNPE